MRVTQVSILLGILVGGIILVGIIAALVYFTKRQFLLPSDSIQIITLIVLVLVIIWYAVSTSRIYRATTEQVAAIQEQTEISSKAVEIALNAEKNAVVPIVALGKPGISGSQISASTFSIYYKNVGKGPALNLKIWLEYWAKELGDGARSNIKYTEILGEGANGTFEWHSSDESLPLPDKASECDIAAKYTDIYGQRFCSKLTLCNEYDREFSFGRCRN